VLHPMPIWKEFLCVFMLFLWPGCLLWIWFPIIGLLWNVVVQQRFLDWIFFAILVYLAFGPLTFRWRAAIRSRVTTLACQYFSCKFIWEETLEPEKTAYILVAPPHGVFPFGNLLTLAFWDSYANFHFSGAGASILFYVPIMRHVLTWLGCIKASPSELKRHLSAGKSIGLSSGGIAELFESNLDHETIIIRNRKGFVKLAMLTNAKIVPCYLFGNTQALHCLSDSNRIMSALSRKLQTSLTFFWGRYGLPIAYRTPILGVMGKPISVPFVQHESSISMDEVNKIHAQFVTTLEELFDKHKAAYGWAHKKLIIH